MPRLPCLVLTVLVGGTLVLADKPGAQRAERPAHRANGFEIEYSPAQEAYLAPLVDALTGWRPECEALLAHTAEILPLSAADLLARREDYLLTAATAIGLERATELQRACYDTFVNSYATIGTLDRLNRELAARIAGSSRVAIWRRDDVLAIMRAGGQLDGFVYDAADRGHRVARNERARRPADLPPEAGDEAGALAKTRMLREHLPAG